MVRNSFPTIFSENRLLLFPQLSLRVVRQVRPVRAFEKYARVGWRVLWILEVLQEASHAKVEREPAGSVDRDEQILAVPVARGELLAFEGSFELGGRGVSQDVAARDGGFRNALVQRRRIEILLEDLTVRKFGHASFPEV